MPVGLSIKYLGLVLDGRLNFEAHFAQLAPRVEKVALSQGLIMPNMEGPRERVRRRYASVTQSMIWTAKLAETDGHSTSKCI